MSELVDADGSSFSDPPSFLSVVEEEAPPRDPTDVEIPFLVEVVGDRLLVRRDSAAQKVGEIYLPQVHREVPMRGTVVAVGRGKWDKDAKDYEPLDYVVGDRVLITRYAGNEFKFDIGENDQYTILRVDEVLMKLTDIVEETDCELPDVAATES